MSLEVPAQGQSVQGLTLGEGIKSSWGPRVLRRRVSFSRRTPFFDVPGLRSRQTPQICRVSQKSGGSRAASVTHVTQSVPWVACALGSGHVKAKEAEPGWDRTVLRAHGRQTRSAASGGSWPRAFPACVPRATALLWGTQQSDRSVSVHRSLAATLCPPAPPRSGQVPVHRARGRLRVLPVAALAM